MSAIAACDQVQVEPAGRARCKAEPARPGPGLPWRMGLLTQIDSPC
ncbi:hypothetical protein [Nonomuraea sp. NPDC049480]